MATAGSPALSCRCPRGSATDPSSGRPAPGPRPHADLGTWGATPSRCSVRLLSPRPPSWQPRDASSCSQRSNPNPGLGEFGVWPRVPQLLKGEARSKAPSADEPLAVRPVVPPPSPPPTPLAVRATCARGWGRDAPGHNLLRSQLYSGLSSTDLTVTLVGASAISNSRGASLAPSRGTHGRPPGWVWLPHASPLESVLGSASNCHTHCHRLA